MASVELAMTVRVADLDRTKLLVWELRQLADEMRVMASPHAERLERAIDRYTDGGDDEGGPEEIGE